MLKDGNGASGVGELVAEALAVAGAMGLPLGDSLLGAPANGARQLTTS